MSKSFGPPGGPVNWLDNGSAPLNAIVSSGPLFVAYVRLNAPGARVVVERFTWMSATVVLKAPPETASGRKRSSVIQKATFGGKLTEPYTSCSCRLMARNVPAP